MAPGFIEYTTTYGSGLSTSSLVPLRCPSRPRLGTVFKERTCW